MANEIVRLRGIDCEVLLCGSCGVVFAMPAEVLATQRKEGGFHTCPNGHSRGWTKEGSEDARIRRERDNLLQQLAQRDDQIRDTIGKLTAERENVAKERKARVRIERRIHAGVCSDCSRTFPNLTRHMQSKHGAPKCEVVAINAKINARA